MSNSNGREQLGVQRVKSISRLLSLTGAVLALGLWVTPLLALDVTGSIPSGRWQTTDSPVRVTGDIELGSADSLVIEPGVRVEFTGPYVFVVRGFLDASGTSASRIMFTMEAGVPDSMRWGGIRFVQALNGSRLHFARIEKGWARGEWPLNCGGGIYVESCNPIITRSEIVENRADADGGGYFSWYSNASISNTLFHSNYATNFGGALFFSYSSPQIMNCTVALDTAGGWGGGIYAGAESHPVITNSIVTNNVHQLWEGDLPPGDVFTRDFGRAQSARPSVSFSNIGVNPLSPFPGSGNIYLDPEFVQLVSPYDFHLKTSSPDVDGGDPKYNASAEPDVLVNRIDVGSYGGTEEATLSVPVINVNFNTLNFGNYRLNAATPKEIKILNKGHYRLFLSEFRFSSRAFYTDSAEVDDEMVPAYRVAPIEPGEQAKFTIYFKPSEIRAYSESVVIVSNDTINANPTVTLTGTGIDPIASMVDTLRFDNTAIGGQQVKSVWVHNTGRSNLTVEENGVQGESFSVQVVDATVAPRDSGEVRITFAPRLPESYAASAGFGTNDRDIFIYLLGRGFGPKLVLADTSARFLGYVYVVGDTAVSTIQIRNEGDRELVINSAVVGDPVAFSTVLPVGGLVIPPGGAGELIVRFHPTVPNLVVNSQITINSNYPIPQVVRISGRGMAEPGRYVFGHVNGTWEWSAGHDDYIVLDSVFVPLNKRLKIEAGARILFEPGAAFIAAGEVRAIGTETDSIHFLPRDNSGTEAARWRGINLSVEDASRFAFCSVKSSREGIIIREASPRFEYSRIAGNGDSAAIAIGESRGGGLRIENSGAVINGCVIEGNKAALGGAIYVINSKPTITNSIISGNTADDGSAIYMKFLTGGLYQSLVIDNNTALAGNSAITVADRSAPRFINCTIADNAGKGIRVIERSLPTILNSIIWDNTSPFEIQAESNALVTYTDYSGGLAANKNLDLDPGFIGSGSEPYRLASNSQMIDKGNPESTYRDYFFPPSQMTSRNDLGAYGGPLGGNWESSEIGISLFQNPAFPRWCDVIVSAEAAFVTAPVCSVEFVVGTMNAVALTQIDAAAYRGRIESPIDGTIFLTANGQTISGVAQKIGRTFEVKLMPTAGGSTYVVGLGGELIYPEGVDGSGIITTTTTGAVKPGDQFMPVTASVVLSGVAEGARLVVNQASYDVELSTLHLYKKEMTGWSEMHSTVAGGQLNAGLKGSGEYVLAIGQPVVDSPAIPMTPGLMSAYPNPFNGGVTISFDVFQNSDVKLTIHDLAGRQIETLASKEFKAGRHEIQWNAVTDNRPLSSGIYWARLETEAGTRSIKLLLVR